MYSHVCSLEVSCCGWMEGHCSHNLKSTLKAPDKIACVYGSEICRNGAKFRVNCMQECDRELYRWYSV